MSITVENITKIYGSQKALDHVSFSINEGEIVGLLGPNGAGKSTLMKIITCFIPPTSGNVEVYGNNIFDNPLAIRQNIGYLPEERGLYKKMKVGEQLLYLARLKGLTRNDAKDQIKHWLRKFDIEGWEKKKVEELSKGMQQKIQFIATVIHRPQLLIFDEPFSGFDPINVDLLKNEILELKKNGTTIIFSTHNMSSVEELCDDILLINNSKAILSGKVKDIQRSFKKNIFELVYSGDSDFVLPNEFERISYEKDNFGETVMNVQLNGSESSNALLAFLLQQNIQIKSFKEILPTMNEIFIETVKH